MIIKIDNIFIKNIEICLYVEIVIKPYYISQLILSNRTNINFEERKLSLTRSDKQIFKF